MTVNKYAGRKEEMTANSGTDVIINQRLCFFAQVLLLISGSSYAAATFFLPNFPSLFSFCIELFRFNLLSLKKKKK